jgi:Effector-associated domain 11
MSAINNVKQLISEGKTKEALDTFQTLLEGSGREELNQSLLLESQYNDILKKMQLGLVDANAEVNRINFALLTLCDQVDASVFKPQTINAESIKVEEKTSGNAIVSPLILFSVLVVVALVIVFVLIKYIK